MIALWLHYWPILMVALAIGLGAGLVAFRLRQPEDRRRRWLSIAGGAAAAVALTAAWHGPFGTAGRFAQKVESGARQTLDAFEMTQVEASLDRDPLYRVLVLSGPADEFQRSELIRIMSEIPGVGSVRWQDRPASFALPLLAEATVASLLALSLGLLLAYLIEIRRRSRASWRW